MTKAHGAPSTEKAVVRAAMRRFDSWRTAPAAEYLRYDHRHAHAQALIRACARHAVAKGKRK